VHKNKNENLSAAPWRQIGNSLLTLALGGATLCAIPTIVGAQHWMLDNLTSFTLQLFVVLSVLTVMALVCRKPRIALVAGIVAVLVAYRIYPHVGSYLEESSPEPTSPVLSWLVANVLTSNIHHDELIALIRERNPDVIGLVETDTRWLKALDEPLRGYPHRVLHPREDNFGIALYSRVPLIDPQVRSSNIVPTITASIEMGDRQVDIVLVHVLLPVSQDYTRDRNEQLADLGALRARPGHGLVIAGDFNATPYSPAFRKSFPRAEFVRAGGIEGTFPAGAYPLLRIPIDHVIAAGSVTVRRKLERDIGSDHLPFMVELWPAD
jgi:endonuclease/exonuclease/phosphatase (EEP) superfamily protein YafD